MPDDYYSVHGAKLEAAGDMVVHAAKTRPQGFEPNAVAEWVALARSCPPSSVMVDAGTYTGIYSILAGQNGATCIGFELDIRAFARAYKNIEANDFPNHCKPSIRPVGLSDRCENVKFYSKPFLTSAGSLVRPTGALTKDERAGVVVTLDSHFREFAIDDVPVHAIKVDVEGAEIPLLIGAQGVVRKYRPTVIIEALSHGARGAIDAFFHVIKRYERRQVEPDMFIYSPLERSAT